MNGGLYNKKVKCPVCSKEFEVTKVKSNACKVASRDSDFCVYYEGINPIFYDIWVCEHCGYAAQGEKFDLIRPEEVKIILNNISAHWAKRSFAGERSVDMALDAFKLALYNLQLRKGKQSDNARVCIRIAWLYRIKQDDKENDFLRFALRCYTDTYEKEKFPADKLDEYTCMYMIAELNRRVGNIEDSIKWFSRLVGSPEARKNPALIENAREQYQIVKDAAKKMGRDVEGQAGNS